MKKFIFTIEEKDGGVGINMESVEGQEDMSLGDASVFVVAFAQMLKENGLSNEELKDYFNRLVEEIDVTEEEEKQEEQDQEEP